MQIERIFYPVRTLGYGKRIGIWTIGCPHGCFNCSNPELWESNPSKEIALDKVFHLLDRISEPIDGVTITGGDPFVQPEELYKLVSYMKQHVTKDILVYSGFTWEELQQHNDRWTERVLQEIAVLIDGKYIEAQNDNRALRGSANQQVYILNEAFRERYEPLLEATRQVQTVYYQHDLLSIGIPMKTYDQQMQDQLPDYGIHMDRPERGTRTHARNTAR